ncbi:zinc finger, CCHC-type containing protein [Tanacetum coccineum]
MPSNKNKVCKLIKSLYGLKQAPKQWHQKFDEVVLSIGYLLKQANKCIYRKFDESGKGVIICLYVDDMLIFGTDQVQVDLTKEFLSSIFSMKDMKEADVILMSTPIDTSEKLMPNNVGKLSMYTSNPGTQHWQAIQRVLKYLKKNIDYSLTYIGYPLVLDGYTNASWISNAEYNSSTSGWDDDVAWWIDSGATEHVCKDRCWFKTYKSLNDGYILHMGNESTTLYGHGCVELRFSSGKIVSLFNVLHVPNIRKNLVLSSILNNCGYKQVIKSNKFILYKYGVFISFGYLSNQMFMLNIVNDDIASTFTSTSKLNDSILLHARLGHVHFKRMQDMSKDGLISAFDMDTKKCKTCMMTKITKKPFQNVKRDNKVLELMHINLYDLHATPSLGNKKYFVTFIDDASRLCYVYLLHSKDEALDKFKVFKTKVELQQGSLIKRFRTNRGGEYMDTLLMTSNNV